MMKDDVNIIRAGNVCVITDQDLDYNAPNSINESDFRRFAGDYRESTSLEIANSTPVPDVPLDMSVKNLALSFSGLGKEVWGDLDPDEYVRKEREDWD